LPRTLHLLPLVALERLRGAGERIARPAQLRLERERLPSLLADGVAERLRRRVREGELRGGRFLVGREARPLPLRREEVLAQRRRLLADERQPPLRPFLLRARRLRLAPG